MKNTTKNPYANHGYTVKAINKPTDAPRVTKTTTSTDLRTGAKK